MAQNAYTAPPRPYPQPLSRPAASDSLSTVSPSLIQYQQEKPRPQSRAFSFRSDRSSSYKGQQSQVYATHQEKGSRRIHSKADPTLAMNEAEPSAVAAGVKSSLAPLRSIQHKDVFGNPIMDPDRSNPTRSRWERPLDTIPGFEAAIDGAYNARRSYVRADSDSAMARSRTCCPPRFPHESYYSSRQTSYHPDSQLEFARQRDRDSYFDQPQGYGARQRFSRMLSESGPSNYNNGLWPAESSVYPMPNNHRSYETVASGGSGASASGSSGGEPAGYTTDPTSGSENSSIDRNGSPSKRLEHVNDYGISFSQNYHAPSQPFSLGRSNGQGSGAPYNSRPGYNSSSNNYAVQPPQQLYNAAVQRKDAAVSRKPTQTPAPLVPQPKPSQPEKRKSWLMRRFRKKSKGL